VPTAELVVPAIDLPGRPAVIACSTIALDGAVFGRAASAASPIDQQILNALTSLQNSVSALQSGAISDLQSQLTALQNA